MSEERVFTKEELGALFTGQKKMKVVFEKKDGSLRTMICTSDIEAVPEAHRPGGEGKDGSEKPTPDHLFKVFDLEKNGWRSFTIAKVQTAVPVQ